MRTKMKWFPGILLYLVLTLGLTVTAFADENVIEIGSVVDWNQFANSVTNGTTYVGKTVKMTTDIGPVTTIAGTNADNATHFTEVTGKPLKEFLTGRDIR